MKIDLLKKKFQRELEKWMDSEGINQTTVAWLVECSEATVSNWVRGYTLPNRNNGMLLAYFAPELKDVLERIAGLPAAKDRWNSGNLGKKAA